MYLAHKSEQSKHRHPMTRTTAPLTRRRFGALLGGAALGIAANGATAAPATIERRVSGLRMLDWREHFETVENDAILCNLNDRVLHYWGSDGFYRVYPTSVALSEEMSRRGRTEIVLKRPEPEWRPTPSHAGSPKRM